MVKAGNVQAQTGDFTVTSSSRSVDIFCFTGERLWCLGIYSQGQIVLENAKNMKS